MQIDFFGFAPHFINRLNTFRLWVVQLFAIIKEYETDFEDSMDANLCTMIEYKVNKSIDFSSSMSFGDDNENLNSTCEPVSYAMNFSLIFNTSHRTLLAHRQQNHPKFKLVCKFIQFSRQLSTMTDINGKLTVDFCWANKLL